MNTHYAIRMNDDLERQLLAAELQHQALVHPVRFIKRIVSGLIEMSHDLVAARAKTAETLLV